MSTFAILQNLAIALAVGLIVGVERGWGARTAREGSRIAGIRTFSLVGLTGGMVAILTTEVSPIVAGAVTVGMALLLAVIRLQAKTERDIGATSEVASVVTFVLGVLGGAGHAIPAAAGAIATALLLGTKAKLHRWLRLINERELFAALQFVLISAVILPLVPDAPWGPYGAVNPYRLWWLVVLVTGVSFLGYVAVRLFGSRVGPILTGMVGGLVASTATTFALLRRERAALTPVHGPIAAGIVAANAVMTMRVLLLVTIVNVPLGIEIAAGLGAMSLIAALSALWLGLAGQEVSKGRGPPAGNPLNLHAALMFALLLAAATIVLDFAHRSFGAAGVYSMAVLSALIDVDVAAVTLAQLGGDTSTAAFAIIIAASVNTAVKIVLAAFLGSIRVALRAGVCLAAVIGIGIAVSAIWIEVG